jgi:anti-sigma B factor antagonist
VILSSAVRSAEPPAVVLRLRIRPIGITTLRRYADGVSDALGRLSIDVRRDGETQVVVAVAGEVDMATAPQLGEVLGAQTGVDLVVDLSGVPFLDSSGLSVLVRKRADLAGTGRTLRVIGEQDNVRKILEVTGLLGPLHGDGEAPSG